MKYFGSYTHFDSHAKDSTYNILLEYADHDLEEYFADKRPPTKSEDIIAFWEGIVGLCHALQKLHNLEVQEKDSMLQYYG